ncbi:stalk domain-containing protein [Cohnella sp. WQ 127256]|uniref:stalk domain-containing protein n=1 Tax=Cohnella sp. WQ 127256 TaxID=2938790 RepID=UPI0021188765|nr:stalk domain-containing protein [Cohnella sp. WQ 127256]
MNKKFKQLFLSTLLICSIQSPLQEAYAAVSDEGKESLVLIQGSNKMLHNGVNVTATQPLTEIKGVTYVAARSFMNEINGTIDYVSKSKTFILSSGENKLIFKTGTSSYTLNGVAKNNAAGAPYELKGSLMIPVRTVAQNFGMTLIYNSQQKKIELKWGTATTPVKPPNQPPVALFSTEKDTYKMGELITYQDQSTDDLNKITSRKWNNNESVFFEPGPQIVTLTVTDDNGSISEYSRTITITDETLYSKDEFNLLYTDIGDKFGFSGPSVLTFPKVNFSIEDREQTLIKSNSPEMIMDEGIYYEDMISGKVRFIIHNQNGRTAPVKVYILLTNENSETATVRTGAVGMAGPNPIVSTTGRAATGRYLESLLNPKYTYTNIPAGESRLIFTDYSSKNVRPGDVYSMFGDVQLSANLKLQVVVVDANRDMMSSVPNLQLLPNDAFHIRGKFEDANRTIYVNQPLGSEKSRMILVDNVVDPGLTGVDNTTGKPVVNMGNYGVLYTVRLNKVQPNTAIVLNSRGGHYAGAFTVNGKVVYMTNSSILTSPNEVGMLYKTGDSTESVTVTFTPASGSMLPINLLFLPMPAKN